MAWSKLVPRATSEARRIWRLCNESGEWPDYPARELTLFKPEWDRARWAERETIAPEVLARAADWQKPPETAE